MPAAPIIAKDRGREGLLLGALAYSIFSAGDALVKSLGQRLHVFEIGMFIGLVGCLMVPLVKQRGQPWRVALTLNRPWGVEARALAAICSGAGGIYAFTHLPLSDAYALIFLAPLFVTILGRLFLKEEVTAGRWAAIVIGFCGVLIAVRPGFETLTLGHLAAVFTALFVAIGVTLLRSVAAGETRTAVFAVMMTNIFLFNGFAVLIGPGFTTPAGSDLPRLIGAGIFGCGGQAVLIAAARIAPASRIAPGQYVQLAWAVGYGALLFGERPDALKIVGLALIGAAGLLSARAPARSAAA